MLGKRSLREQVQAQIQDRRTKIQRHNKKLKQLQQQALNLQVAEAIYKLEPNKPQALVFDCSSLSDIKRELRQIVEENGKRVHGLEPIFHDSAVRFGWLLADFLSETNLQDCPTGFENGFQFGPIEGLGYYLALDEDGHPCSSNSEPDSESMLFYLHISDLTGVEFTFEVPRPTNTRALEEDQCEVDYVENVTSIFRNTRRDLCLVCLPDTWLKILDLCRLNRKRVWTL
jgi:hypothetical protein